MKSVLYALFFLSSPPAQDADSLLESEGRQDLFGLPHSLRLHYRCPRRTQTPQEVARLDSFY